jgi:cell volume regulation protein A
LRGEIKVGDLEEFYEIKLGTDREVSLGVWLRDQIKSERLEVNQYVDRAGLRLRVISVDTDGAASLVGMTFLPTKDVELEEESSDKEFTG